MRKLTQLKRIAAAALAFALLISAPGSGSVEVLAAVRIKTTVVAPQAGLAASAAGASFQSGAANLALPASSAMPSLVQPISVVQTNSPSETAAQPSAVTQASGVSPMRSAESIPGAAVTVSGSQTAGLKTPISVGTRLESKEGALGDFSSQPEGQDSSGASARETVGEAGRRFEASNLNGGDGHAEISGELFDQSGKRTGSAAVLGDARLASPDLVSLERSQAAAPKSAPAAAAKTPAVEKGPGIKRKMAEALDVLPMGVAPLILTWVSYLALGSTPYFGMALAASWFIGTQAAVSALGDSRSVVVDGWQASHDQRYRVGGDGQLRDVRGHKYGEDRYERRAPGLVGPTARKIFRVAAAMGGAIFLINGGWAAAGIYAAALGGLFLIEDAVLRRRGPQKEPVAMDPRTNR